MSISRVQLDWSAQCVCSVVIVHFHHGADVYGIFFFLLNFLFYLLLGLWFSKLDWRNHEVHQLFELGLELSDRISLVSLCLP